MMRRRPSVVLTVGLTLCLLGAAGAQAATTRTVSASNNAFSPATVSAAEGDTIKWVNDDFVQHTTTSTIAAPVGWSGSLFPGTPFSKTVPGAGTYAYHCDLHPGMNGKVRVPVIVTPSSGSIGATFTVKVSSAPAPNGFAYVPQVKIPGNRSWTSLSTTTSTSVSYVAQKTGKYLFRSKIKHGSQTGTAPSPTDSVMVG